MGFIGKMLGIKSPKATPLAPIAPVAQDVSGAMTVDDAAKKERKKRQGFGSTQYASAKGETLG